MSSKRYVFDTNTIVSAFLFEHGKPGRALDYAQENGVVVLLSTETAQELSEVLERDKFDEYVQRETRQEFLLALLEGGEFVEVEERIQACRDPDDDKFLELAVGGRAERIVTGDKDLLVLASIRSIPIVTADEFLREAERNEG